MEPLYRLCVWIVMLYLAVAVLSQDCTFDNDVNTFCGWSPERSSNSYVWKKWRGPTPEQRTGPQADHTSGSGNYIFAQSSVENPRSGVRPVPRKSRTRFTSPTIHTSWTTKIMRFYYYMYGKHVGILNVFSVIHGRTDNNQADFRKSREGGQTWKLGEVRLPANSTIKIVFEAVSGKGMLGDIAIDDISFHDVPADCTFEEDVPEPVCRYSQDTNDNFDWQVNSGKTPTRRTGPSTDHTLDTSRGTYMYIESSGPNPNDKAYLVSPRYTKVAGNCEISFWYHMYGEHIGHLKVHIMTRPGSYGTPAWQIGGDQGSIWHEGVVNITDVVGDYQIVFEGIRGKGHAGDISIDDIKLQGINCITRASFQELTSNETNRDHCASDPCVNGGVCRSGNGRYICNCTDGWAGDNCQLEATIDYCENGPCQNEGRCVSLLASSSYRCECLEGWSGRNCQVDERDKCASFPCRNAATCTSFIDRYECECTDLWTGINCEIDERDKCASFPCRNAATCTSFIDRYECECTDLWTGINCEIDVDECSGENPCLNGGTCINTEGSFNCTCPQGWHGKRCIRTCEDSNKNCPFWAGVGECTSNPRYMNIYCQRSCGICQDYVCEDKHASCVGWEALGECQANPFFMLANCHSSCGVCIDDQCVSNPCLNGATCTDGDDAYNCTCAPGYEGYNCEVDIDECATQPCQNGGTCIDGANGYTCNCTDMYLGSNCEQRITPCDSNPCHNSGTCTNVDASFTCTCPSGFSGNQCQTDIDECASNPCLHGGTCEDQPNGFLCHCVSVWTGPVCDIDFDECNSNPCNNGAMCYHGIGLDLFVCTCTEGWQGTFCQMEVNECESSPCQNEGMCTDRFNGYNCTCAPGWNGFNCEIEIKECASSPCRNGKCVENINGYTCLCFPGFTGDNCDIAIDECDSQPCQNGAQCVDQHNGHLCYCATGFAGRYCEQAVDECASQPCQNGAQCTDQHNGYLCVCTTGFTGLHCERGIDECASWPCSNGALCVDKHNGYTCQCTTAFTGRNCEQAITTTTVATTPKAPTRTKVSVAKLHSQSPTRPVNRELPTTTDWVPKEFDESYQSDSDYSGSYFDDSEKDVNGGETGAIVVPETSTSNQQGRRVSASLASNDISTSRRAKPASTSDLDKNEITILQTLPVSKISGKTKEPVSKGSVNASLNQLHAPAQVAPIGHIIAIVVGAVFVITILAFLIILVVRQKKKARIGRYEHFSMDFKKDPVAWKDLDNRSDDTDPDLAVAKM